MNDMTANEYKNLVDSKLSEFFNPSGMSYDGLLESMHYSLTAGGKRIRPSGRLCNRNAAYLQPHSR